MKASIIICTKNRSDSLARLFDTIELQTLAPDELVVVDASDNDETSRLIDKRKVIFSFPVKYIKTEPGLTRQRNVGVRESRGDTVIFLDDDITLEPSFIQIASDSFKEYADKNVYGMTFKITNAFAEPKIVPRILKKIFFLTSKKKGKMKLSGFPELCITDVVSFVEVLGGAAMAYRREVFSDFQFDEKLTGYCYMEDIDFSSRVGRKFKLLYQPMARCAHYPTTFKEVDTKELRKMLVVNHWYLFMKNSPKTVLHWYAFIMSIIGLLLSNILVTKDLRACEGILDGIRESIFPGEKLKEHL